MGRSQRHLFQEHLVTSDGFGLGGGLPEELTITDLDPISAVVGSPDDITLRVIGVGFSLLSKIFFNNGEETTVFVSITELTTIVKPSLVSAPVTVPIEVHDGPVVSNQVIFEFTEEEPVVRGSRKAKP